MSEGAHIGHPVAIGQVIVNFAASYGIEAPACLTGTGITEYQLRDADTLIERKQELRLFENLILALPDVPALGFELGLRYHIADFGLWGFLLRTSRTLREAIHFALRYLPLSTAYCRFSVFSDADEVGVLADPDPIPPHLRSFLLERDTATAMQLFEELGLQGFRVQRIEYQGPAPDHADRIRTLCGITPQYGRSRNAVVFRREDADRLLPMYDPHLVRFLEDQCRAQLEKRQLSGLAEQIRRMVLGPLGLVATIDMVAKHLTMAPRSLRRKLEEEGTNFRELVDAERRHLAAQLLLSTEMKLEEVAAQLGYSDTAGFTRAFHRWFDQAPGEFRKAATGTVAPVQAAPAA